MVAICNERLRLANYTISVVIMKILISCSMVAGVGFGESAAAQVPAMFAFGDSLIDVGNNNFISSFARSNYYPYGIDFRGGPSGRFTNGRTSIDMLAVIRCERPHRFTVRIFLRSPPYSAGEAAPLPKRTPTASLTTFYSRRVRRIPVFRPDHPKLQTKSIWRKTEIRRTRREWKMVGEAAGVHQDGEAPWPARYGFSSVRHRIVPARPRLYPSGLQQLP
ncbi:hypothetical protein ACLB2K_012469 [Fragaria x ananassa]